jgi:hypothetical protein
MSRIIRQTESRPTFPIVGKLKIGIKHPEKGYPMALDHFRPHCDNKQYEALFAESYGDKPNKIEILFASNDDHACKEFYELRDSAGKILAEGDGENFRIIHDGKWHTRTQAQIIENPKFQSVENFMEAMKKMAGAKAEWKETLIMRFLLPKIKSLIGLWEFRTHGDDSTIPNLVGVFDNVKRIAGTVQMIPFDLFVKKVKSDKSGVASSYSVVNLVPNIGTENMLLLGDYVNKGLVSLSNGILTDAKVTEIGQQQNATLKILPAPRHEALSDSE